MATLLNSSQVFIPVGYQDQKGQGLLSTKAGRRIKAPVKENSSHPEGAGELASVGVFPQAGGRGYKAMSDRLDGPWRLSFFEAG